MYHKYNFRLAFYKEQSKSIFNVALYITVFYKMHILLYLSHIQIFFYVCTSRIYFLILNLSFKKLRRIVQQIERNYILHFKYNIQNTYNINKKIH